MRGAQAEAQRDVLPGHCAGAVATHAVRHLAWLRRTDEAAATALAALWHALDDHAPAPAGALT
ncbi:hypothetical protein [Dactylosporangium darangshiense]|uniref:Uncharacterized protein n=1 Tax=Dactylosporangium darangshiense TaxID=579108 RepID=A0ABP8DC53_9ACTN